MRKIFILFAVLSLGLAACGGGGRSNEQQKPQLNYDNVELEALVKNNCLSCHGAELQGRSGPNLQTIGGQRTKEELYEVIAKGKRNMPAFDKRLNEEEIDSIATWLSGLK